MMWCGLPSLTSRAADQAGGFGHAVHDEPGVHGDAAAADAGAGLEDLDARVAVGQFDHPPDIQAHAVADHRQLVGEGDVDVAVGVLGQLDQFGRVGVGHQAGALDEDAVKLVGAGGASGGQAADDAVVFHQFQHHAAGQDAFRQ